MRCLLVATFLVLASTPPLIAEGVERIALLGCIRQDRPLPALQKYLELDADLHLWIGDNIYADTDDPEVIRRCYGTLRDKPGFRELLGSGDHMFTWDDHDYGDNNVGRHYRLKAESKDIFVDFWGLQEEIPESQPGIWYARSFGDSSRRLQVIMLDVRYHRDDPNTDGQMLGPEQMAWLRDQLTQPADLRLIVSGTQVLLPKEAGSETWDQYPRARQRLFDAVRQAKADHVVFITGDQHYGEVCRKDGGLGYDVVEFQFCGLNQIEEPEFNPFRVSPVCASTNSYAYLDVHWEADEFHVPNVQFHVGNSDNDRLEVVYRVNFSELEH